jgi:flavin reductase (DIM6/NTAB) family NADH-FMN oxidoreductase RutF
VFYETEENRHGLRHNPFKALVAPRPIGWISTLSQDGVLNLAPYSFFNAVSDRPPFVLFSSGGRKDSVVNAEATGEFVCSLATYELREQMNQTSAAVGPEVDEMELAKLQSAPSKLVKPPRVAASPAALECKYYQTVTLPGTNGLDGNYVVIGRVVGVYIADEYINDGMVDVTRYKPIGRLGYMDYAVVESVFSMNRPD